MIFYRRVVDNFLDAGLLRITKLTTDNGADRYTIRGFRNRVRELVRPEYQADFRELLRRTRFDQTTVDLLERARNLRNGRVAHFTQAFAFQIPEQDRLDFTELVHLRDVLNSQLDALSFNTGHLMLPPEYSPLVRRPADMDHKTDIEEALDSVARNSALLNLPEREAQMWSLQRANLTDEEVAQLNHYRRKFGLPEV